MNFAASQTELKSVTLPLGIVIRRTPGVTVWQKWVWKAVAVLPGANAADWTLLRREGEAEEYHAVTLPLELFRTDAEAYMQGLTASVPSVYVVLREGGDRPEVALVTASPFEAQDYADTGEDQVEKVHDARRFGGLGSRFHQGAFPRRTVQETPPRSHRYGSG